MKFFVFTELAELLDLAMALQDEGHEVIMYIPDKASNKIGDGIVKKVNDWWRFLGKGYIWVFDSCAYGDLQDWLREKGEYVCGGSKKADELENNRQLGQKWFKEAGFPQPSSKNFKSIDDALRFVVQHKDKRYILKQNGDAPKSLNHLGKFDSSEDMIFHLEELKKKWNEAEYGQFDCDLMEVVEGLEVAASVFFNGRDFLKNKEGKVVGYLNFEEKKESDGQTGETTGETGTTFIGVTEDNALFREIVMRPKLLEVLRASKFHGVFDVNGSKTKDGFVAFEPTMRFGVPATSYEFMEGLDMPIGELISMIAKAESKPISINQGVGMVLVVSAKPFPIESHAIPDENTSLGEKLWILKDGKTQTDFSKEQKKHVHLANFLKKDGHYIVASDSGYLLTVTGRGKSISEVRNHLIQYVKDNLYISGMKYRTDIGLRVEEYYGISKVDKMKEEHEREISDLKDKHKSELDNIKKAIKKTLYET